MATYHFRIKSDKKPDGTRISAVTHAEYVGREGKFSDIDRKDSLRQSLAGNFITTEKVRDAFDGKYIPLYYTDDYGSIANTSHGITLTENPSLETIAIALSLADEALGHQPLIVRGSEKFKRKVMEVAVLSELHITFADIFMQQEFQQKREESEDERKRFRADGGKFLPHRHVSKSHTQSLADPSLQALADAGFRLPTLSQCTLVSPEPADVGLLLSDDEARELVNEGKQSYSHVRWDVGRERGRVAGEIARGILQRTEEHMDFISAAAHVQYINREKAFAQRGGCIYQSHQLPKWAKDSPKKFFAAADRYESAGNRRYREIEFSLPNELTSVEEYREIVDEFLKRHLGNHYYAYAIHDKIGAMSNGERHPHVHIMFSERLIDDVEKKVERPAKLFFKYPARKRNGQDPTFEERKKHGAPKDRKWSERSFLAELRADFARIQNDVLEKHGFSVRVDHRSLKAQRREALQNGDTCLAQLLDRVPEKYIGLIAPLEEKNPQVKKVKKYRMARKEHQDILYAADMLEREIEELALKDDTQKASLAAKEVMDSEENQLQNPDSSLIGELRDNVLSAIREVNALKNAILTKNDAEEQAMLEYLTAPERELWHKFKDSKAQKTHWETFMGSMKKPPSTEPEALRTYEEITDGVAKKIHALDASLHLMQPSITELMAKLNTPERKTNIQKAVHQLLMNDRPNRDKLKKANEHLDHAVEALRQVVFSEVIKEEHRKIFTTGQIYEILRRQYFAQKREYQKSLERTAQLKKKVISQNRALSMAEDLYLKGARKKIRADLRKLKKLDAPPLQEQERLMQELERLNALCQKPEAKAKIEEIAAGILRKNGKWATSYAEAEKRSQDLADRLHQTQKRLNAVKHWLSRENPRTRYRLVMHKASPQGATRENGTALVKSAASVIADAMLGYPEAVQLVARSSGDGLETEKTWTLMTKLDKDAMRRKALLRDI